MKFIFCGYDFAIDTLMALEDSGHKPIAIFSFPGDDLLIRNARLEAYAQDNNVPFFTHKPAKADFAPFIEQGTEMLLSTGYLYKIPETDIPYAVNIHPSLLPKARGLMPLPFIIQNAPEAAGLTAHKITPEYDAGDILLQQSIPMSRDTDMDQLMVRLAMAMPDLACNIVNRIEDLWENAKPQIAEDATYAPEVKPESRHIDWGQSVQHILTQARAFGRLGLTFTLKEHTWITTHLSGWEEPHTAQIGQCVYHGNFDLVIRCADGFIALHHAEPAQ